MKNNFQSNGKGRNQRVWQLLISMLIILTMGIGQMWGDTFTATEIVVQNEGKTAVIGTTKNHVTVYSPGITSTSNQQIWVDGSTAKKEATVVISADASNSALQDRSGSYIEIKADDGYTLGTTIGIRGGGKGSAAKIAPVIWWSGTVSSTFTGAKLDLSLPANTITSSAAADLVVTIPSGMKVVRIYRKVRLNKDAHTTFVNSGQYEDIGGGSAAISSVTATAVASSSYTVTLNPGDGAYASAPTGWTADGKNIKKTVSAGALTIPEPTRDSYEFNGWKAGETAVTLTDGKLTVAKDTTLVAQWTAPKATPTVTFNDSNYVVGAAALNLSGLFESQNTSDVSFALKVASEDATISGSSFTATKAGSYVVVATQAADDNYKAVSKEATITVTVNPLGSHTLTWTMKVGKTNYSTLLDEASSTSTYLTAGSSLNLGTATTIDAGQQGASDRTIKVFGAGESATERNDNSYVEFPFTIASGYMFTPTAVSVKVANVSTAKSYDLVLLNADGTSTKERTTFASTKTDGSVETITWSEITGLSLTGSGKLRVYAFNKGTTDGFRFGTPITITGTVQNIPTPTVPTISAPTADSEAEYDLGSTITALEVTATGYPAPAYQWYKNATKTTEGATAIDGAESASYTPANNAASDFYYYCVATNASGSATSHFFHVTVSAAVATAPSFTSPASEPAVAEYSVGDAISALEVVAAGYPAPTLQWYSNSSKSTEGATLITGAESASYTPSNAAVSDLYFYCVATNASGTAQSEYFHVTVAAVSYCTELVPATSGDAPAAGGAISLTTATGGSMKALTANISYSANGLLFGDNSGTKAEVTLTHLMQVGTIITATIYNGNDDKARGLNLLNSSGTSKATWTKTKVGDHIETYTVVAGDGLAGSNVFQLQRNQNAYLKDLKVSNCGAELHALTSAIDPIAADGKATITLSKTLVATGATATATYSDIDAAYDFDEWVVSGATIDDAKANPVTITMGSTDATITLKLKAAAVKYTVTYYDGDAIPANKLDDELIVEGNHPTGAGLAPRKLGYTFAGWSTSNGGAVVALNTISVDADMPLFAVWNAIDCASKTGTIYTMEIAVAPAANCTIKTASGFESTWDLYQYEGIVGGEAMIGNTGGSNNCILQTNKTVLLKDNTSYMKLDFDCPLKEGDTIKTNVTGSGKAAYISTADTRPEESAALAIISNSTTGKLVVPAALNNATSVYLWKGGGNVTITSIEIVRPVKHSVTFNMNGHGDDVAAQSVVDGAKATEPTPAPTADGYRFVKWQLSGADYDFDAAVTTDIELDAVWQKTWTVTFNSDGGSDVAAATVDDGQAVAQPANPMKGGYDFVEWRKEGESVAYNFATTVTANITLVAQWEVAQDDASLSALSYNSNAIDVSSAVDVSGVQTYTVHLQYGSTVDASLISVTKNAESASLSSIVYNSENLQATFSVESGNHSVTINYAIQFVIDPKRGTSIIKATTNNVVTGLIGGTIDQSYSGNANSRKLNKNNYFGVTLANDETFQEGDVFIVNITTPADLGKFMIYADKNRTELIADQGIVYTKPNVASPVVCPTGEMMLVLPAAANGKKSLYLSRENVDNSEQWNVTFSYIEVTREMAPVIKSFKFGDEAATINESAKTITYEVAYGTDVTALTPTVEAYGNNGATYTPDGATDFTSPVNYVVKDAYNEYSTTYAVTVNVAAPSENANLASLAVAGYSLDFDPAVVTYNVVLDYGTTELPAITYEVEEVGIAAAAIDKNGVSGATTITVTPQAGAGYEKVYTINFSVNTTPTFKVFDGRTMNAAIVSFTDPTSGMTWTSEDATTSSSSNTKTINGKTYTKSVKIFGSATSASRYLKFTVPADYVAKFYLAGSTNSSTGEATLFFSKELTADPAKAIAGLTASVDDPKWAQTDYQLPGDYYFCVTGSARIYELSVTLYPIDEERAMTQGRFGTICYPNGGRLLGAMLLEIAYFDPDQKKIFFDEVIGGQMVAGAPYLFLPNEGVDKFAIVYTDNVNAPAGHHNGLYGSYTQEALPTDGNHYIMLNNQYCKVVEANTYVGANRAYIQLDKIGNDYVAPSYGRRRVSLGVQQAEVATGLEDLNVGDQPIKIMINGQMYILRGEKMYDATGRLVK